MVLPDLGVVIPTLGRPSLEACLSSILAGTAWPAEVVVVDQATSPWVADLLRRLSDRGLRARHVASSPRGRSAGVNQGIALIATDRIAITDDDCLVAPDWLRSMAARLDRHPEAVITGRVEPEGTEAVVAVLRADRAAVFRRPGLRFEVFAGGNMGASRTVLQRAGPFAEDPRLAAAEDCEWSYRALRTGIPIVYAPEVVVRHLGWRDQGERAAQYRRYARSHGAFYGTYLRRGDWFIGLRALTHFARALVKWTVAWARHDSEERVRQRAYLAHLGPGIATGLRRGPP